ncbi:hypothetical protein STEG23_033183 [Scotinomys teguina]
MSIVLRKGVRNKVVRADCRENHRENQRGALVMVEVGTEVVIVRAGVAVVTVTVVVVMIVQKQKLLLIAFQMKDDPTLDYWQQSRGIPELAYFGDQMAEYPNCITEPSSSDFGDQMAEYPNCITEPSSSDFGDQTAEYPNCITEPSSSD